MKQQHLARRLWLSIAGVFAFFILFFTCLQLFYRLNPVEFTAELSEMHFTGAERLILFEDHTGNNPYARLLRADGATVYEGDVASILLPAPQRAFVKTTFGRKDPVIEEIVGGQLTPFELPHLTEDAWHMSFSPDEEYVVLQGGLISEWYILNQSTGEWSNEWVNHIPEAVRAQYEDGMTELEWEQDAQHRLFIIFYTNNVENIKTTLARYQYNPETDTFTEYPLDEGYGPLKITTRLEEIDVQCDPLRDNVDPTISFRFICNPSVPANMFIRVTDPIIGKQRIILTENGVNEDVLSWFSTSRHYKVSAWVLSNEKLLIRINQQLGVFDRTTKQFARLQEIPPEPTIPTYSVYVVPTPL